MTQELFDKFISNINEYKSSIDHSENEDLVNVADTIVEWVEDNKDVLECECLDDIFDEYVDMRYYANEGYMKDMFPNGTEDEEELLINDDFDEEIDLIETIREYCCEDEQCDIFDEQDEEDELERCCLEEEEYSEDSAENEEIFDYITRHALATMGILEDIDDPAYDTMLEKDYFFYILAGLAAGESDELIAARTMAPIVMRGYMTNQENLQELIRNARTKCKMHAFVLNMTGVWLYSQNQDPTDVMIQVMQMLGKSE